MGGGSRAMLALLGLCVMMPVAASAMLKIETHEGNSPLYVLVDTNVTLNCTGTDGNATWVVDGQAQNETGVMIQLYEDMEEEYLVTCGDNATGNISEPFRVVWATIFVESMGPSPYYTERGANVTLMCTMVSNKTSAVWREDGVLLDVNTTTITVTSDEVGMSNFTCAENSTAMESDIFIVGFACPEEVTLEVEDSSDGIYWDKYPIGSYVQVECIFKECNDTLFDANYTWYLNDTLVETNAAWTFNFTQDAPGKINVTCFAEDEEEGILNGTTTVWFYDDCVVAGPEGISKVGLNETVEFTCNASKCNENGSLSIMWLVNGNIELENGTWAYNFTVSVPLLYSVTCQVINDAGVERSATVIVEVVDYSMTTEQTTNAPTTELTTNAPTTEQTTNAPTTELTTNAPTTELTNNETATMVTLIEVTAFNVTTTEVTMTETMAAQTTGTTEMPETTVAMTTQTPTTTEAPEVPPVLTASSEGPHAVGSSVNLTCSGVTGETYYFKNGDLLGTTPAGVIYVVTGVAGEYNLTCANSTTGVSSNVLTVVFATQGSILVSVSATPMSSPVNKDVVIQCSAVDFFNQSKSIEIQEVVWYINDVMNNNETQSELVISSDVEGNVTYKCLVNDSVGGNSSDSVTVTYYMPVLSVTGSSLPTFGTVNETVVVTCAYSSNYTAETTWYVDDVVVATNNETTLNVTSDEVAVVEVYCRVVDEDGAVGSANVSINFFADGAGPTTESPINATTTDTPLNATIESPMNATTDSPINATTESSNETEATTQSPSAPVVNTTASVLSVIVNQTILVNCSASSGVAPYTYSWVISGASQAGETNDYIYVTSSEAAVKKVTCTATGSNGESTTSASVLLTFTAAPVDSGIYPLACTASQGYSWATGECEDCVTGDEYNDGNGFVCEYCDYNTNENIACRSSDGAKSAAIDRKDICISTTIKSQTCNLTGITLAAANEALTADTIVYLKEAFPSVSDLCVNTECQNVFVNVARKSQLCSSISSCSNTTERCFQTTATLCLYDVKEFVNTGVNNVKRRAEEVFLESLRDTSVFPANQTQAASFVSNITVTLPPTRVDTTAISATENRVMYAKVITDIAWTSNHQESASTEYLEVKNAIEENLPGMFGTSSSVLYVTVTSLASMKFNGSDYVQATIMLTCKTAISATLTQALAEIAVRSHSMSEGAFGSTSFKFQSEVNIFSSLADMESSTSAVAWCSVLDTLSGSISLSYCTATETCIDTSLWYECGAEDTSSKTQKELYTWGTSAGDSVLEASSASDWYWYYHFISPAIKFSSGAPFGNDKLENVYVYPNGALSFGDNSRIWWPTLSTAQNYRTRRYLAVFHHNVFSRTTAKTYYQLYQKAGTDEATTTTSAAAEAILTRAKIEVQETLGVTFEPKAALVVTWERAQPYSWWQWLCTSESRYNTFEWWTTYYRALYQQYCTTTSSETNTFQTVYVTDGHLSFVITTYKQGEMNWQYDRYRRIDIGYTSPSETRDFGVRYTDLTTKLTLNTFNTGRYGTWMAKVGEVESNQARCLEWYADNLYMIDNSTHTALLDNLYTCPCTMGLLGSQWTWYSWNWIEGNDYRSCVVLGRKRRDSRISSNPYNKMCCYRYTYPTSWTWVAWRNARRNAPYIPEGDDNSGHFLKNEPYYWRGDARLSRLEDFEPRKWCCSNSEDRPATCPLFNAVRPTDQCSSNVDWFMGRAMGDPHITTLDGLTYTFNGKGQYVLMKCADVNFELQARTDQAVNSDGVAITATVFVGFVVKENTDTFFQVLLNDNKTGLLIKANTDDITTAFYADGNYTYQSTNDDLTVEREDRDDTTVVIASFASNIALEVYIGVGNLDFLLKVPTSLKGKTTGLMGNYNDDKTDEFILPDGTQLTSAQTDTEREIFEDFGKEWEVTTSNSIFEYENGETAVTYQFLAFEPIFTEDVNASLLAEANSACNGDLVCMFDLYATGDTSFASQTLQSSQDTSGLATTLTNNLPVLTLSTSLNAQSRLQVTHGVATTIQFAATDEDGDSITFQLAETYTGLSVNNATGAVSYTPDKDTPVAIGVQANDGTGVTAAIYVNVIVCTTCSNSNGTCDYTTPQTSAPKGDRFLLATCNCNPAWEGADCADDVNGCQDTPCAEGQECVDLTPAQQGTNTIGYTCGNCPTGYQLEESECVDLNECVNNGTEPVCSTGQTCVNSIGSYSCSCNSGYRVNSSDASACQDIDECADRTHNCTQICTNNDGGFNCSCASGTLSTDGVSCIADNSCTKSCTGSGYCAKENNVEICQCNAGYSIDPSDDTKCEDTDECTTGVSPCSQECTNTDGGFTCSCYDGFKLSGDGVTCEECASSYWGPECANQCDCNGQGTCDTKRGCVCTDGYTGTTCVTDVDECAVDGTCPAGQLCTNSVGSYTCSCPAGYLKVGTSCDDIDECLDVTSHTCDIALQDCVNNVGSYSCTCRDGHAKDSSGTCVDVDECTQQSHDCQQNCVNTEGSFNCECYVGYKLNTDRKTCVQLDDPCEGTSTTCDQICTVENGALTCKCYSGYGLLDGSCQDINECEFDHLNLCSYKDGCKNEVGGFNCSCSLGTYLDNDGRTCVECGSGTWGENCANSCDCDAEGASSCDAKFGCQCNSGYTGTKCNQDVDECASGATLCTQSGEECINTRGSSSCECINGYSRVLGVCTDDDECAVAANNDCDQKCNNFPGGYRCSCNSGFKYTGTNCTDIDECADGLHVCEGGCENTDGAYRCTCADGLKLSVDGTTCMVAEFCSNSNSCTQKCAVSSGEEICFCNRGYSLNNDGVSCSDIDYCADAPCETGHCTENINGTTYECSCPNGKKLEDDGFTCTACDEGTYGTDCSQTCSCVAVSSTSCDKKTGECSCKAGFTGNDCSEDIDECAAGTDNCSGVNDQCENTPGSFVCKCNEGYFRDGTSCTACSGFTFGDECSRTCDCDREHSTSCNAVSGACVCATGYTGTRCDTDIDECADVNNDCDQANIENWVCVNLEGSHECRCTDGYEHDSGANVCNDLDECAADFLNECNQNCTNTVGNYTCSCDSGYSLSSDGRTCIDDDECTLNTDGCEDVCTNSDGSFACSCNTGRDLNDDNSTCYTAFTASSTVTLTGVNLPTSTDLREHTSSAYLEVKALIEASLFTQLGQTISNLRKVTVTDLRKGSLIVDYTTTIDQDLNPDAATAFTDAIVALASSGVTFNGTNSAVTVVLGSLTITSSTDKCTIMNELGGCADGATCSINSEGSAVCDADDDDDDDDIPLIVGLCVGIPLGLALIAAIAVAIWYKGKYKGQRRVNDRNDTYGDNPNSRSGSPDSANNFRVDMPKNSLIDDPKNQ